MRNVGTKSFILFTVFLKRQNLRRNIIKLTNISFQHDSVNDSVSVLHTKHCYPGFTQVHTLCKGTVDVDVISDMTLFTKHLRLKAKAYFEGR